ncbi:MAG: hypothetical protein NC123_01935 [Butyrivibrio sp.]|nr:hypothetical protein [Acetatifactor muris]MCM1558299.1 hypothetical protein [Butyrivibrio sp.]
MSSETLTETLFEILNHIDEAYIAEAAPQEQGSPDRLTQVAKADRRLSRTDKQPGQITGQSGHTAVQNSRTATAHRRTEQPDSRTAKTPGLRSRGIRTAACAAVFLCAAAFIFTGVRLYRNGSGRVSIPLSDASKNVTASYVESADIPAVSAAADLAFLTETEIFSRYDTVIFRGTVTSVRNIELDFNGWKEYQALAEIRISRVFRGDLNPGDTLTVLLPCPIMAGCHVSDCTVAEAIRPGTEGIFMPVKYDDSYLCVRNNATLQYNDIADYGLFDGSRWAFLSTDTGLLFDPSTFESLKDPETLDDIELYITKMLGQP